MLYFYLHYVFTVSKSYVGQRLQIVSFPLYLCRLRVIRKHSTVYLTFLILCSTAFMRYISPSDMNLK